MSHQLNSFQRFALSMLPDAIPCGNWVKLNGQPLFTYDGVRKVLARQN